MMLEGMHLQSNMAFVLSAVWHTRYTYLDDRRNIGNLHIQAITETDFLSFMRDPYWDRDLMGALLVRNPGTYEAGAEIASREEE